jgi:hypothetical protein
VGSLLQFAAFANKINVNSEGERRLCGTKPTFAKFAGRCFQYSLVKPPTVLLEYLKHYDEVGFAT